MNEDERFLTYLKAAADRCIEADTQEADHILPCPISARTDSQIREMVSTGKVSHDHRHTTLLWQKTAVACLLLCVVGLCIQPVRAVLMGLVTNGYDDHISVSFAVEEVAEYPTYIEEYIVPTTLPEGWTMEEIVKDTTMGIYCLQSTCDEEIYYFQQPLDSKTLYGDTECTIQEITLQNTTPAYLFTFRDNSVALVWQGQYMFILEAEVTDMGVLISIAESVPLA